MEYPRGFFLRILEIFVDFVILMQNQVFSFIYIAYTNK